MKNTQQLNPAGYLINDEPINKNPFFSFDSSEVDPSIDGRLTNIENNLTIIENNITQIEEELDTLGGDYQTLSFDLNALRNSINDIQEDINHLVLVDITDLTTRIEKNERDILDIKNELSGVLTELEGI